MLSQINSQQSFRGSCTVGIKTSENIEAIVPYVKKACEWMGKEYDGIRRTDFVEPACRVWSSKPGTICIDGYCPVVTHGNIKHVRILDDNKETCEKLFQTLFKILKQYKPEYWLHIDRGLIPNKPINL